ncbi:chromosome partitioning protein ParA [Vibrio parahaemolyticus]|uniref:chromosome partitioning protein ParA n=1 Tax=Vibrio parahaemolyticus TaxID=670 RepID=UPI00111D8213|nr:chromosome partitioning protein ParA [Vibrio parahaemolyticus]EMA2437798.1 chromosome partitioning protein ParA [Vibrio parahaemolyticus]TOD34325.1 chromosome partitioning protein ParA [Vibrio parahaemolyticus]
MASINGLPPSLIPGTNRTNRTNKVGKKGQVKKAQNKQSVGQPSKVANAVAHSIKQVDESQIHRAQVQYDLPEGNARKAMEQYMDIMNRAKKEELAQLLGVDIYV